MSVVSRWIIFLYLFSAADLAVGQGTDQSSDYEGHVSPMAVDSDIDTCADTQLESVTWWRTQMAEEFHVHTIVMKTGVGFGCKQIGPT